MVTDNPLNDAISHINRLDSYSGEIVTRCCYACSEYFLETVFLYSPSKFEDHHYCPQCLQELKLEANEQS